MLLTHEILQRLNRCQLIAERVSEGLPALGVHRSRRLGNALEFDQYRLYAPGDDVRQLDWHLYARSDELAVRVQTPETIFRVGVIVDASASMDYCGNRSVCTKMRLASILAACLGYLGNRQGDELGLFVYRERLLEASGTNMPFQGFCTRLDSLKGEGTGNPAEALEHCGNFLSRRGMSIWISDFLGGEETLEANLRGLKAMGCGCLAIQVLDVDETEFPFNAPRRFIDPEGNERRVDAFPDNVREDYLKDFNAHQARLKSIFNSQEVPFVTMTSQDDIGMRLSEFLR